jgi:hypothetical protein
MWRLAAVVGDGNVGTWEHPGVFRSIKHTTLSFSSLATMDLSDTLVNSGPEPTDDANASMNPPKEDDIWLSSRTARQIYGLCQVERVSTRHHPTDCT